MAKPEGGNRPVTGIDVAAVGVQPMRLSSLMLSVTLAAAALASNADAAVVTIKVSGTYTAGSEASLPASGTASGEIFVESNPFYSIGQYTVFEILSGSYITFGSAANNYKFSAVQEDPVTIVAQSSSDNFIAFSNGRDRFSFSFTPLTADPTVLYAFASTPVGVDFNPDYNNPAFTYAIGGRPPTGDVYWRPGFTLTLTTQAAPGPAPEPATWALMLGGFGLVGATLRRRRVGTV